MQLRAVPGFNPDEPMKKGGSDVVRNNLGISDLDPKNIQMCDIMPKKIDYVSSSLRNTLYFVNFILWVLSMLTVGLSLHVHYDKYKPIMDTLKNASNPAVIIIALGILLFIATSVGCVGAKSENMDSLRAYILALLFLLMVFLAMGLACLIIYSSAKPLREGVEESVRLGMNNYRDNITLSEYVDLVQTRLTCCGMGQHGYEDWSLNKYYECSDRNTGPLKCSVPPSCCKLNLRNDMCGYGLLNSNVSRADAANVLNTEGCIMKIEVMVKSACLVLGGIAFGVSIALAFGLFFAVRFVIGLQEYVEDSCKKLRELCALHGIPEPNIGYNITEPERKPAPRGTFRIDIIIPDLPN